MNDEQAKLIEDTYGGKVIAKSARDAVANRRLALIQRIREQEARLDVTLTQWQLEAALAYLTLTDFATSGRGGGKTFLAQFLNDAGLVTEWEL